jgi:hypothetical protein
MIMLIITIMLMPIIMIMLVIFLIVIYFNWACTEPIIPYTQQTDREPQYSAPACTTLLYFNGTPRSKNPILTFNRKGCVGKAAMVRTNVVKTQGREMEQNPTPVEPTKVQHLPLEHACSIMLVIMLILIIMIILTLMIMLLLLLMLNLMIMIMMMIMIMLRQRLIIMLFPTID